jgi:hypothetical protein
MEIRQVLQAYVGQPLTHQLLTTLLREYKRPNDKIHELMIKGILEPVKKGLYVPGSQLGLPGPEPFLLANHILGPSYVSLDSAMSFHGMIPERVFGVSSVTTKASRKYNTSLGQFNYIRLPLPYYSFGLQQVHLEETQFAMIASPEKALCDKVVTTAGVVLRSVQNVRDYLQDDLRIDEEVLRELDPKTMRSWLADSPKRTSLLHLVKTLEAL